MRNFISNHYLKGLFFLTMESIHDLWVKINDILRQNIAEVTYEIWIKPLSAVEIRSGEFVILAPNNFIRTTVLDMFTPQIEDAVKSVTGLPLIAKLHIPSELSNANEKKSDADEYTFSNFIVGSSNQFAFAAASAVAQHPGNAYNPLFIYGNSGLGKTHLLFAIKNEILKKNPTANIVYIKGDQFTIELIDSLKNKNMSEFRAKYRWVDVLLVDDVQFIGGKDSTQEEFFHTFNSLYQERNQIVLTSDRPPKEIASLDDRLRTRFENGLLADIQPPDFETRMAIIKRKGQDMGLDLGDDICVFIAEKLKNNIRQIEGVVKKISVLSMIEKDKPSIITAQNAIKDVLTDVEPVPVTIDRVMLEVSRTFDVAPDDIRSNKRSGNIPLARQSAMYIIRQVTDLTYKDIGDKFTSRDHTTVIYSVNQIEARMKAQPDFKTRIDDIIRNIRTNS